MQASDSSAAGTPRTVATLPLPLQRTLPDFAAAREHFTAFPDLASSPIPSRLSMGAELDEAMEEPDETVAELDETMADLPSGPAASPAPPATTPEQAMMSSSPRGSSSHLRFDPSGCGQPRNKHGFVDIPLSHWPTYARPSSSLSTQMVPETSDHAEGTQLGGTFVDDSPTLQPTQLTADELEFAQLTSSHTMRADTVAPSSQAASHHASATALPPLDINMDEFVRLIARQGGSNLSEFVHSFNRHGWHPAGLQDITSEQVDEILDEVPQDAVDTLLNFSTAFAAGRQYQSEQQR